MVHAVLSSILSEILPAIVATRQAPHARSATMSPGGISATFRAAISSDT